MKIKVLDVENPIFEDILFLDNPDDILASMPIYSQEVQEDDILSCALYRVIELKSFDHIEKILSLSQKNNILSTLVGKYSPLSYLFTFHSEYIDNLKECLVKNTDS
jgi:hypothetical protein